VKPGDQVNVSIFADGERVDVIGTSRGKGFQGVVKRHHFAEVARTHGSMFHRRPDRLAPRRFRRASCAGCGWPGNMGADQVTVRNLKVLRVDAENNLLLVEGSVPGGPNSVVVIRKAVAAKKIKVAQVRAGEEEGQEGKERGEACPEDTGHDCRCSECRRTRKVGSVDLRDEGVRRPHQDRLDSRIGGARQRRGAPRHPRHQGRARW
jgi:hypothetical protein